MWLKAKSHVLATASPMPNGIEDWKGYMSFIEHEDADTWWSAQSLKELDFAEGQNLFDMPYWHHAAKLQLTTKAIKDWILAIRLDPVTKELRLAQVWEHVLLRRTKSITIPLQNGEKIGDLS